MVGGDAFNIMLIDGHVAKAVRWRGYTRFGSDEHISTIRMPVEDVYNLRHMVSSGEPVLFVGYRRQSGLGGFFPDWNGCDLTLQHPSA